MTGPRGPSDKIRLTPITRATWDGVPLSLNRAPALDLEPWVGRVMVALTDAPQDYLTEGHLCNDAAYLRTAVEGRWDVATADAALKLHNETFLCGQHSKIMPLTCQGSIKVAGIMLKPGAIRSLWGGDDAALLDRITGMEEVGANGREVTQLYEPGMAGEEWLLAMEDWLRQKIRAAGSVPPDRLSQKFEEAAFADPNQSLADFAGRHGVTQRTLQRQIKRDFGLTPKQIMRRARSLDLATRLCGVADEAEESEFLLRFFDQSHLIREFTAFFGQTPHKFAAERQALLTLSLEIRQSRRLEMLNRIAPDAVRPWMRHPLQPPLARRDAA